MFPLIFDLSFLSCVLFERNEEEEKKGDKATKEISLIKYRHVDEAGKAARSVAEVGEEKKKKKCGELSKKEKKGIRYFRCCHRIQLRVDDV